MPARRGLPVGSNSRTMSERPSCDCLAAVTSTCGSATSTSGFGFAARSPDGKNDIMNGGSLNTCPSRSTALSSDAAVPKIRRK